MTNPSARAWVEIDLGALKRNALVLRERSGVAMLPMVKADAYGLGVAQVVNALLPVEPWGFGVATIAEGRELRALGYAGRVIVFTPLLEDDLPDAAAAQLTPALGSPRMIAAWTNHTRQPWHLAIDTGMSRAGAPWREVDDIVGIASAHPPEGVFTHFHSAELDNGSMELQEANFRRALQRLTVEPEVTHSENSAAIARRDSSAHTLIRPGIFLYGVGSGPGAAMQPEPVVSMRARVAEIRDLRAGDTVSYDATYKANRPTRIATLSVGYADGYPRALGNVATVSVRGRLAQTRGVVTMDMTMVDVTDANCEVGDVATLLGSDGAQLLTVENVAREARMSPYELLTGLRSRIERVYVGDGA